MLIHCIDTNFSTGQYFKGSIARLDSFPSTKQLALGAITGWSFLRFNLSTHSFFNKTMFVLRHTKMLRLEVLGFYVLQHSTNHGGISHSGKSGRTKDFICFLGTNNTIFWKTKFLSAVSCYNDCHNTSIAVIRMRCEFLHDRRQLWNLFNIQAKRSRF